MLKTIMIAAVACACVATIDLAAQAPVTGQAPPAAEAGAKPPADRDELSVAELTAALDAYALVQAQQQLQIGDDKYSTFAARLKRLQDVRRRNQRMRFRLVQDLRRLAGARATPQGDDTAVRAALTALRDHDEKAAAELRQAYDALDQVLDVRQQARFRLFEEHIEQRKLELLVRAQRARQQGRKAPL
jgi:hypothetical protein